MNVRLTVRLPIEEKKRLAESAMRRGCSASALVRVAIRREVDMTLSAGCSPLAEFFGSVDCSIKDPTNIGIREVLLGCKQV
jgi:hypothetical protein